MSIVEIVVAGVGVTLACWAITCLLYARAEKKARAAGAEREVKRQVS